MAIKEANEMRVVEREAWLLTYVATRTTPVKLATDGVRLIRTSVTCVAYAIYAHTHFEYKTQPQAPRRSQN